MIKEKIILENETGLHARPASEIAKIAMKYNNCEVNLVFDGKKINAKSPLMIMSAGIKSKSELEIECNGDGEEDLCNELKAAFENNFGE